MDRKIELGVKGGSRGMRIGNLRELKVAFGRLVKIGSILKIYGCLSLFHSYVLLSILFLFYSRY